MNSSPSNRNIHISAIYVLKEALVIKKKYSANTPEMKQKKARHQAKSLDVKQKIIIMQQV